MLTVSAAAPDTQRVADSSKARVRPHQSDISGGCIVGGGGELAEVSGLELSEELTAW